MTDKNYVNNKIIDRLSKDSNFSKNEKNLIELKDCLNNLHNVDIMSKPGTTFDESVLGWITFCNIVLDLVLANESITVDNIKKRFKPTVTNEGVKKLEDIIDDSILNRSMPDLAYLLSISEETNIAESVNPELLTEEGMRSLNFINSDETSLDAKEISMALNKPIVFIKNKKDTIYSPFTNSTNVFKIDENNYLDLESGEEFIVHVNDHH